MPKYYQDRQYSPRIQQAMDDAVQYATPKIPADSVVDQGGYLVNNPAAGAPQVDVPVDKVKYYDRLESNLREIGDSRGVMKVQKEREEHLAEQKKSQYEDEKRTAENEKHTAEIGEKKSKAGENRLKYIGSVARKNADIYNKYGQEKANEYFQSTQQALRDANLISDDEMEPEYDHGKASAAADLWDKQYGWKEEVAQTRAKSAGSGKGGSATTFVQVSEYLTTRGRKSDGKKYTPYEAQEEARKITTQAKSMSESGYVASRMKNSGGGPAKVQQYKNEYSLINAGADSAPPKPGDAPTKAKLKF